MWTASQSISWSSVNSQPRQKLANTGVGKIVGWATPNSAPSATLAADGSFAVVGDMASVTRDLAVAPATADEQIERVSGSFLVTD